MRIINTIKIYSSIAVFILSFEGLIAQSTLNNTELSFSNSFDSNYISEGRCNLSINGYVATSLGIWKGTSHENHTWGGISVSTDF